MECVSETGAEALDANDKVDHLDLKPDEQLLLEIEKTFREITSNSAVGRILCREGR